MNGSISGFDITNSNNNKNNNNNNNSNNNNNNNKLLERHFYRELFNRLPDALKQAKSLQIFKRNIVHYNS